MKTILFFVIVLSSSVLFSQETDSTAAAQSTEIPPPMNLKQANLKWLIPPEGFIPSDYFHGYIDFVNRSAIYMYELELANLEKASEPAREKYLADNGSTLLGESDFLTDKGVKGYYLKSGFESKEREYLRYTVYVAKGENTIILDVVLPGDASDEFVKSLEASFKTVDDQRN